MSQKEPTFLRIIRMDGVVESQTAFVVTLVKHREDDVRARVVDKMTDRGLPPTMHLCRNLAYNRLDAGADRFVASTIPIRLNALDSYMDVFF